jgi:hypothetical protein
MAPTAMPILAPRVRPPVEGLKDDWGLEEGLVIWMRVLEKTLPDNDMVLPDDGCC